MSARRPQDEQPFQIPSLILPRQTTMPRDDLGRYAQVSILAKHADTLLHQLTREQTKLISDWLGKPKRV